MAPRSRPPEEPNRLPRIAASLGELAEMTGVSERTLRKWAREEGMPVCRVGGRVLVLPSDFEAWLRTHQEPSPAEVDAALARVLE